jgi:hypothetical protein
VQLAQIAVDRFFFVIDRQSFRISLQEDLQIVSDFGTLFDSPPDDGEFLAETNSFS